MADGWITIGTELATDKFDRQIVDLEKKMKKEEDKKILLEAKLDTQEQDLEKAKDKVNELSEAYEKFKAIQDRIDQRKGTLTDFTQRIDLKQQYGSVEKLGTALDRANAKTNEMEMKIAKTKLQYDGINAKVNEYKTKINQIDMKKHQAGIQQVSNGFKSVGNSIQEAVGKAGRLVLGIFAVRSAYMALRSASSYLASYDKQYAANIEYIKYALTQMIAPVLYWIVNLAAKLLGYINMIINALFGINLFSRGSAENFNKMKAGAGGVSKAVKEIKKQLAGFDEINMLTDQSDSGTKGGGGGVGTAMPNFDLSALEGETPDWLKWLVDHKDLLFSIFAGIAGFLVALKLGLGFIKGLGIGLIIAGIVYAVQGLMAYLKDPSWENFGKIIQGIGVAIIGLGIIIGVATGGWVVAIVGAIVLIVGTIIKYWDQIKAFLQSGIDWLTGKSDWVHEMFGSTIGSIYDGIVKYLQLLLNWFNTLFTSIKGIFDGIIKVITGVFTGDWNKAWEGVKEIFFNVWNLIKARVELTFNIIKNVVSTVINIIKGIFTDLWNSVKEGAQNAWNWITSIFGNIVNWFNNMINTIINKFRDMGTRVGETVSGAFRSVVNSILGAVERILNKPISAINSLISVINSVPGINLGRLSSINLPRLKVGGIVNMPNKGTMLGGAITGEAGREGVVPLTDQQAMAELGREIGKNVLVNLTNITSMNGRIISREMKQVQSDRDFAFNT